jgi:hypothetical protein
VGANGITFVGMDAHNKAINVAMLLPEKNQPLEWQVANEPAAIRRLAKKLEREAPGEVRCCYEAGPCGYALQRGLEAAGGIVCEVVAPSLIPVKPGERIKTDRRDARKLAELQRANLLTVVYPPTVDEESVRDLCRCREDAQEDLGRARAARFRGGPVRRIMEPRSHDGLRGSRRVARCVVVRRPRDPRNRVTRGVARAPVMRARTGSGSRPERGWEWGAAARSTRYASRAVAR